MSVLESLQLFEQWLGVRQELLAVFVGDGIGLRQLHGARIAVHAVEAIFVMQVYAGDESGLADITDRLSLSNT